MPAIFRLPSFATIAAAAFIALPAQAALPPWHQRAAELRAVLNAPGLVEAFGNALIERVEYAGVDLYRVSAGRCHVDARIVDLPVPRGVVGGRRFEVRLGRRVCR
jgi:hypothetical protein